MSASVENMFTQIKASPAKAVVLGLLMLVLMGLVIKTVLKAGPSDVQARLAPAGNTSAEPGKTTENSARELEQEAGVSAELWKTLRTKRGMSSENAFCFDGSYYMTDPAKAAKAEITPRQIPAKSETKTADARDKRVDESLFAASLVLQSTAVGAEPTAIINSQFVKCGDTIQGYTVDAIRAREVILKKGGQLLTLEMSR